MDNLIEKLALHSKEFNQCHIKDLYIYRYKNVYKVQPIEERQTARKNCR
jgi:hypothetical protein